MVCGLHRGLHHPCIVGCTGLFSSSHAWRGDRQPRMGERTNHVSLVGTVGQYGVKIAWTEAGKPQTSFTLITEEPGPDSAYKTFITDWRSEHDRAQARETLAASVQTARQAVERTQGTQEATMQRLRGKILVQLERADQTLKDPSMLRR
jgi:hypothetical protein